MDHWVEDHLQWRPLTATEADELAHLRDQIEVFDDTMLSAAGHMASLGLANTDDEDSVGGWDHYGSLVAYARNVVDPDPERARVEMIGGVHPTHRDLSIGRNLISWQEKRAVEWRDAHRPGMDLWLGSYVESAQRGLRHLLESQGFTPERNFVDMHRPLERLPSPRGVDGVTFALFDMSSSDELHHLHHQCFVTDVTSDHDHWDASMVRVRPEWSWVAWESGHAVGYALSGTDDAAALDGVVEGWTDRLGVHPHHRRRGLASALLERTMVSMAQSGCLGAGIGVDTTDVNLENDLYGALGYEARDAVMLMSKTIGARKSVS